MIPPWKERGNEKNGAVAAPAGVDSARGTCYMAVLASKEGLGMLPAVVVAGMFFADLARPVTPEEYAQVMAHEVLLHEPLSDEALAYYRAKGQVLACLLQEGMTRADVHRALGVQASGWFWSGELTETISLLGVTVRYRPAEVEVAGRKRLELVVEEVATSPP
jgi:hypothetical protein